MRHQSSHRKTLANSVPQRASESFEHRVFVEASIGQVHHIPRKNLELALRNRLIDIDAGLSQPTFVDFARRWRDDVQRLLALAQTFRDERSEHFVEFAA